MTLILFQRNINGYFRCDVADIIDDYIDQISDAYINNSNDTRNFSTNINAVWIKKRDR